MAARKLIRPETEPWARACAMELMGFTHDGRGIQEREAKWIHDQDCGFCADESQLHCIATALTKASRAGGATDVPASAMLKRVVNADAFKVFVTYMPDYVAPVEAECKP